MAEVQLALQRGPAGFEKLVVVKLVHERLATQKNFVDMLLDEARIAALVKHPNVVDIYDLGEAEGRYFIAMEYLEGEPLLAVLRACRDGKLLDPLSMTRLIAETAEGLDAAHELRSMSGDAIELVHHDVSLGNIVVLYNGAVKLVDFGVAKATMSTTTPMRVQGKFSYMAPEKLRGEAGDRRSDIWSLGVVLWEAVTLRRLFKGGNDTDTLRQVLESEVPAPSSINGAPRELDAIVARALARAPNERYQTAREMASDLEEVLRKRGYGRRNDQIAKYMQATFHSHIVARKKLLQEVSSKGRASAAVLEAAFADAAPDLRTSGEFSVKLPRTAEITAVGTPTNARPTAEQIVEKPTTSSGQPEPQVATPVRPKVLLYAVAVGAIAVIGLVAWLAVRTDDDARDLTGMITPAPPPPSPVEPDPPPTTTETPAVAPTGSVVDSGSAGSAVSSVPTDPGSAAPRPRTVVREKPPNAIELQRDGVKAYVAGDYKTALATLRRAQAAAPGYAPTWRALGLVYEKLGQRGAAKAAFQRYLAIAPKAGDAALIKARVGKL